MTSAKGLGGFAVGLGLALGLTALASAEPEAPELLAPLPEPIGPLPCPEPLDIVEATKLCEEHCLLVSAWATDGKTFTCRCIYNLGREPLFKPPQRDDVIEIGEKL